MAMSMEGKMQIGIHNESSLGRAAADEAENHVEVLKELLKRWDDSFEDGYTVEDEEMEASSTQTVVTVDATLEDSKEEETPTFKGAAPGTSAPPTLPWIWAKKGASVKSSEKTLNVNVEGVQQEVFADLYFRRAYNRDDETTSLKLVLDEAFFGVENCITKDSKKLGHFIYHVEVKATPTSMSLWSNRCTLRSALPSTNNSQTFQVQRSQNFSLSVPLIDPTKAHIGLQKGDVMVSNFTSAFGWLPASMSMTRTTKSVSWSWRIRRWKDGSEVKGKNKAQLMMSPLPCFAEELDPSAIFYDSSSFVAEATWEVPNEVLQLEKIVKWDVEVVLHTAFIESSKVIPEFVYLRKSKIESFHINSKVELVLDE